MRDKQVLKRQIPTVHRRMIDRHSPLGNHFFQMSGTLRVSDIPTHGCRNNVLRVMPTFKRPLTVAFVGLEHSFAVRFSSAHDSRSA